MTVNWAGHDLADVGYLSLITGFNPCWFRVCKGDELRRNSPCCLCWNLLLLLPTEAFVIRLENVVFICDVGHTSEPRWAVPRYASQCISARQCRGQRDLSNAATGVRCWPHLHGRTIKHDRSRQCRDMEWYTPQDQHQWTVSRMVDAFCSVYYRSFNSRFLYDDWQTNAV